MSVPVASARTLKAGRLQLYRASGGFSAALWFDPSKNLYFIAGAYNGLVTEWSVRTRLVNAGRLFRTICRHADQHTIYRTQGSGFYPTIGAIGESGL